MHTLIILCITLYVLLYVLPYVIMHHVTIFRTVISVVYSSVLQLPFWFIIIPYNNILIVLRRREKPEACFSHGLDLV